MVEKLPDHILFYFSLPFYYLFILPIFFISDKLTIFNQSNNFINFTFDIFLTIILILIYWIILEKLFNLIKVFIKNIRKLL